ncbi:pantoate--beta-alanine ligase [bacterium]|nr:MAG: pantoate--beta-alanine ligase [bacterium]
MKLIKDASEMTALAQTARAKGRVVAFVPTMGYLHSGHIKLVEAGRQEAGKDGLVALSIFVNPTQFGPKEDFTTYPRDIERDMKMAAGAGVDVIFIPRPDDMYTEGFKTFVNVEALSDRLCGAERPGHFRGVATVVVKLFNIVCPQIAVFGKKDFQQFVIIKRLVQDLNFPVKIIGVDTVRDPDGLALSSRNTRLSPEERQIALALPRALNIAKEAFLRGEKSAPAIAGSVKNILEKHRLLSVDYVNVVSVDALEAIDFVERDAVVLAAVRVGSTRLIDNVVLSC